VKGAVTIVTTALQLSIGGIIVGRAIQAVTTAYLTRIAGKSFIEYFRHDQDWGDGGITEVVQRQFQLNRRDEFIKSFVQEAISRVVKPLHLDEADDDDGDKLEEVRMAAELETIPPPLPPQSAQRLTATRGEDEDADWEPRQRSSEDWES
jgi:hypothetical protein